MRILVTGGAGFIGSYIVDELIRQGIEVVVIDSLENQVHHGRKPSYLNKSAEYHWAPLSDAGLLAKVLPDVDGVCHQAALVGVGQSMYDIARYCDFSVQQTALLMEKIIQHKNIRKLVVASSMSVYGEGKYQDSGGRIVRPSDRLLHTRQGSFDLFDDEGQQMTALPITEDDHLSPYSIYGLTKLAQERIAIITGKTYDIPTVAFRYFGVYGRRQALSNPYAGLMALFAGRILNGRAPLVFEDGRQTRDFIHVTDVARANVLALTTPDAPSGVYNLTCGVPVTVEEVADALCQHLNPDVRPQITQKYRKGDIRHCFGDISKIKKQLHFTPQTDIHAGLKDLADWVADQNSHDLLHQMEEELSQRYLLVDKAAFAGLEADAAAI